MLTGRIFESDSRYLILVGGSFILIFCQKVLINNNLLFGEGRLAIG